MAARGDSEETQDGETYIEKYTRGVLEVENILSLEKLRQVFRACFVLFWKLALSLVWFSSFLFCTGCDSEGGAHRKGKTLKEECQHTKCTACNAHMPKCNCIKFIKQNIQV